MDAKSLQFKPVFSAMIEKGGNWGAVAGTHKRAFKTVVREVWPALLLTDGEVFVPASFTQEALDEFRKKYGKVHVTDLKDKHIVVNKWALQMSRVDSEKVWHSYGGVEVSLVVQSFAPKANEKKATISFVPNIFREQDIKDTINRHWHDRISESLEKNAADLVSVKKVSEERKGKGNAPEAVHALKKNFEIAPPKGKFAVVKQDAIVKSEKGESYLNNLKKPERKHPIALTPLSHWSCWKATRKGGCQASRQGSKELAVGDQVRRQEDHQVRWQRQEGRTGQGWQVICTEEGRRQGQRQEDEPDAVQGLPLLVREAKERGQADPRCFSKEDACPRSHAGPLVGPEEEAVGHQGCSDPEADEGVIISRLINLFVFLLTGSHEGCKP